MAGLGQHNLSSFHKDHHGSLTGRDGMTRVETSPGRGRQVPVQGGHPAQGVGVPVVVTLVEAPACHLCEDARSTLAVLARSYSMTVHVVSIGDEAGRALMAHHRAPMSPLVLLGGEYFSSGRLPRRKLERRLAEARRGGTDG
jgi:hypothetical protein